MMLALQAWMNRKACKSKDLCLPADSRIPGQKSQSALMQLLGQVAVACRACLAYRLCACLCLAATASMHATGKSLPVLLHLGLRLGVCIQPGC